MAPIFNAEPGGKRWLRRYQDMASSLKSVPEMPLIFCFCAIFLALFRFQALFFPPYWDAVLGPFTEAIWLSENKFDFIKLATQVPGYLDGGARIYLFFSIYPALQAVFLTLIQNIKVFILLNHLIAIGLASAGVALYYETAARAIGKRYAAFAAALLFFNPLFLSQAYAINMEMPALFFSIAAVYCLMKEKPVGAAFLMFLSFLIKYYAVVALLGCVLTLFCVDMKRPVRFKTKVVLAGVFALPGLIHLLERIASERYFHLSGDSHATFFPDSVEWMRKGAFFLTSPDLALLWLFALIGSISFFYAYRREITSGAVSFFVRPPEAAAIKLIPAEYRLPFYAATLCVLLAGVFYLEARFLPRYTLFFLPWILLMVVFELKRRCSSRAPLFILVCLVFYVLNMWGQIYSRFTFPYDVNAQGGHFLERTLAYEDDMNANLALVRLLQTKYKGRNIITTMPIAPILISPKFGYVEEPRRVATVGRRCLVWQDVPDLGSLDLKDPQWKNAVWVFSGNIFSGSFIRLFFSRKLADTVRCGAQVIYLFTD